MGGKTKDIDPKKDGLHNKRTGGFDKSFFLKNEMFSFRKNTETPCLPPASNSRSFECARCVPLILVSTTMIVVWPTTLAESFTWASSRSEKNWTN